MTSPPPRQRRPHGERGPAREPAPWVRDRARGRIQMVAALLTTLMFASGARGVQLAVSPDERTLEIATDKRWAAVSTQGPRGEILDADGNVMAKSVRTPAVFLDPATFHERIPPGEVDAAIERIAAILGVPRPEIEAAVASKSRYVRVARGVHPAASDQLRELGLLNKGLIIEENYRRYYPQGTFAGQVLGYVDEAGHGVQGVERYLDDRLAGAEIVTQRKVNRGGRLLDLDDRDERSVRGATVHLTIDRDLQHATERALLGVMERSQPLWASAVVVEVHTGRIVAMATVPGFDPNKPGDQDFALMRNRAIMDPVEPGSVIKPFTYSAALQEGVTRPDEMIRTASPYPVAGAMIHDDHPHPAMTAAEIIKYSSNVGSAQLGQRLGSRRLISYLEAFGFGSELGIQLANEQSGRRSPARVGPVELATISFGQGVTANLLQLAMATAAIANDGVRMRPILVDRVEDAWGEVVQEWVPTVERQIMSADNARLVAAAMEHVTDDDATAPRARIPGYRVAGKTGTAQKVKDGVYSNARYSSFIGFAPADRPEYAMAILVDEPTVGSRYGGIVAAPVFAEVIGPALIQRGIQVDPTLPPPEAVAMTAAPTPEGAAPPSLAAPLVLAWVDEGWRMPELRGRSVRDVLAGLQGSGLDLRVHGAGALVQQVPPAGTVVRPGEAVDLVFQAEL